MSELRQRVQNECLIKLKDTIQEWEAAKGRVGIYSAEEGNQIYYIGAIQKVGADGQDVLFLSVIQDWMLPPMLSVIMRCAEVFGGKMIGDPYPIYSDFEFWKFISEKAKEFVPNLPETDVK